MKPRRPHPLRIAVGFCWMVAELSFSALTWCFFCAFKSADAKPAARARWLQYSSRRFARMFGLAIQTHGPAPVAGLLICNHLSYLDIIVLATLTPTVFVAKRDVRAWPVFGWFTAIAGTLYVDRERRTHVGQVTGQIQQALDRGALVVLFPEGTSSDGQTVLPLKSSLLEPAVGSNKPLTAGLMAYALDQGDVTRQVCYWGDLTFFPHLLGVLGTPGIRATVRFAQINDPAPDRKQLARQLHAQLLALQQTQL